MKKEFETTRFSPVYDILDILLNVLLSRKRII